MEEITLNELRKRLKAKKMPICDDCLEEINNLKALPEREIEIILSDLRKRLRNR
jgi:hypothetical protein